MILDFDGTPFPPRQVDLKVTEPVLTEKHSSATRMSSSALGSKPVHSHPGQAEPKGFSFSDPILRHLSPIVTAVMVDAAFFLKRLQHLQGSSSPTEAARRLQEMAFDHLNDPQTGLRVARLYRIFVYDAPPAAWKGHRPVSKTAMDLSKTPTAIWRREFHQQLRGKRKVALRLGVVPVQHVNWTLKPQAMKDFHSGKRGWDCRADDDFTLDLRQKGVDMRLGIDIAAVSFKKQVNQIVLISGDADFVPAAKLARREGIDFILDPMWAPIRPELFEHIDGLRSVCQKPATREELTTD